MNGGRLERLMLEQDNSEKNDMAELKKLVLESMRSTLVDNVDPTKFLPFLRSKFVVSDRENAQIKSCWSTSVYDGADKLVDVLCTKGARGYDLLAEAIHTDQTQLFLLKEMNMRLEKLRYAKQQQVENARLRSQDQQRSASYPQHPAVYTSTQHPGGPVMSSSSTNAYVQPPTQFMAMQHYNRGGVTYDHTYYHDIGLTDRGGPSSNVSTPTDLVGTLPPPPGCADTEESMPGGQQQ